MTDREEAEEALFLSQVVAWVEGAVGCGAGSFSALLEKLPGVYPTVVRQAVQLLVSRNRLAPARASALLAAGPNLPGRPSARSFLPLPHPLNYEWRFTPAASGMLLLAADVLAQPGGTVLLFGTPGVALAGLMRPPERRTVFLGEDNPVTRKIDVLNEALGCPLAVERCSVAAPGSESASVVVLDPPWYLDFVRPMLATAAGACTVGGHVLISLAPDGARPSAVYDRARVLALAERLGLDHVERLPLSLRYETPFFEANALDACGLAVPSDWRRGDLLVFRKTRLSARPIVTSTLRKERWAEVNVGRMRLFIRSDRPSAGGGLLGRLVAGDVLPTVSRRDDRRQTARVWTSGNRVFSSDAPETVIAAALAISGAQFGTGAQPELCATMEERDELERVGYVLRDLAALEAGEELGHGAERVERSEKWTSTSTTSKSVFKAIGFG
jgi:hypothetical protein